MIGVDDFFSDFCFYSIFLFQVREVPIAMSVDAPASRMLASIVVSHGDIDYIMGYHDFP